MVKCVPRVNARPVGGLFCVCSALLEVSPGEGGRVCVRQARGAGVTASRPGRDATALRRATGRDGTAGIAPSPVSGTRKVPDGAG
ncbi:hypothetical protein GCM10027294_43050 [Marinactinospora endophytica]